MLSPLPPDFARTHDALHAVAEHVLAPARYRAEGRIGLRATPGGFGTPRFGADEQLRVDGVVLVHARGPVERRTPLTTLAEAAAFAGVPLGAPSEVYTPMTPADPDRVLALDDDAARVLAAWFDLGARSLEALCTEFGAQSPSPVQLWPEHFDLGTDLGDKEAGTRANYGASPGDDTLAEPYLYVGPWDPARRVGAFAAHPFGAAMTYEELRATPDPEPAARAFLVDAARALLV